MKIVAICTCEKVCTGLRLAGVDSYYVRDENEAMEILTRLDVTEIGLLVMDERLASKKGIIADALPVPPMVAYLPLTPPATLV